MASTQTKLTANNFDATLLTLEDPMENKERKGVYSARLKYDGQSFLIQTPKLYAPFGASSFNEDDKYNLVLSLSKKDEKQEEFKGFLNKFSERVSELVSKLKSKKLAKKKFQSMVKEATEEKYDDRITIKLKCNQETGELFAKVYNRTGNEFEERSVNLDNITKEISRRSNVRGLLMLNMWFVNDKCGVTVNAKQLIVYPSKDAGCMFEANELSDDEVEETETTGPTQVESEDESDEE